MGLHRLYAFGTRTECSPFPKQKNAGTRIWIKQNHILPPKATSSVLTIRHDAPEGHRHSQNADGRDSKNADHWTDVGKLPSGNGMASTASASFYSLPNWKEKINEKFTLKKEGYAKIKKEQRRLQNESGRPEARSGGSGNFLSCVLLSMGLYRTGSPVLSRFAPLSKSWRLRSQNSASVCGNACFFLERMVR